MTNILFIDNPECLKNENIILFNVPANKNKQDLIRSIEIGLGFKVAGTNWDSLDENLSTGEWAKKNKVILNHTNIPKLSEKDLKIYLEIINDNSMIINFENKKVPFSGKNINSCLELDVKWALVSIFPKNLKQQITKILIN